MTKVLVVATSCKTRGGITSVIKAHETGPQWKEFHCHWVQTHRDGSSWRKLLYFATGMLDFLIRIPFYDIVHIHISQPTTIRRKRPFIKIAKALKKNVIVHFHAFNVEDTVAGKYAGRYAEFFKTADLILVLSNWWKEQLISTLSLPEERISVLYNPCPTPETDNSPASRENTILYAGTVNKRKGYRDLIKAFSKIADKYPTWNLVIAGNGEIEQGKEFAKSLGIENRVKFLGWINGIHKANVFQKSSIFCLPSYAEGFPMAVLDAWAYGLPVITTPVGGIPDVAKDGENMLLFNPGDTTHLAECIARMIGDCDLRYRISDASVDFARNQFSQNTIDRQLGEIYSRLGCKIGS